MPRKSALIRGKRSLLVLFGSVVLGGCQAPEVVTGEVTLPGGEVTAVVVTEPVANPPTEPSRTPFSPTETPFEEEVEVVEATVTVTSMAELPTSTVSPTETAEVQINGRNPDGTYFRGRSDAPVVLIDYSDFF